MNKKQGERDGIVSETAIREGRLSCYSLEFELCRFASTKHYGFRPQNVLVNPHVSLTSICVVMNYISSVSSDRLTKRWLFLWTSI